MSPPSAPSMGQDQLIAELAEKIRHHRDRYYNAQPEISDEEFDALEDRLRALAPEHPALAEVGAEPRADAALDQQAEQEARDLAVREDAERLAAQLEQESARFYRGELGDPKHYKALWLALRERAPAHPALLAVVPPRGLDWPKSRHEIPMGSLNKVNTPEELKDWAARCDEHAAKAGLPGMSSDLAVTEKLDGLSLEVVYDGGRLEAAITRGDGIVGENITPNVLHMRGVPTTIEHPGRLSVRGEIVLEKAAARDVVAFRRQLEPGFEAIKSLRNAAAGLARTKEPRLLPGCEFLSVFFYDAEGVEGLETEQNKLELLRRLGFTVPHFTFGDVEAVLAHYHDYAETRREQLDWDIDGLVVRANRLDTGTLLGELNNRPRAAVAFKFGHEMQVTTLQSILWSTGDTGRITPIAQIDPVFLAGAEIRQASLHNLARVRAMKIGAGDQVLVSRRGDVIPYVEKVVVKGPKEEPAPPTCGVCETPVTEDGEYLLCPNELCPARRLGRLKIWVRHLDLLDWGEKTLERFYQEGLVKEPADLYRLGEADLRSLRGFGETSAKRLLEPLQEKKALPFATFIAALGIGSVSKETGKLLAQAGYEDFEALLGATVEELAAIPGLGPVKAEKILSGLAARREELGRLAEVGVQVVKTEQGGPLAGLSFCFSGSQSRPRKELEQIVEKNGGTVASSVTKGVTYLILADPDSTSSKAQKARKLGTEIIDGATFERIVAERGGAL